MLVAISSVQNDLVDQKEATVDADVGLFLHGPLCTRGCAKEHVVMLKQSK